MTTAATTPVATTVDPVDTDPTTELPRTDSSLSNLREESDVRAGEPARPDKASWVTVAAPERLDSGDAPLSMRRVVAQLVLGVVVVLAVVTVGGSFAARRLAEREAVTDAANTADVLAEAVVQPALSDALLEESPRALAQFSAVIKARVLSPSVVRVKLWTPQGKVSR